MPSLNSLNFPPGYKFMCMFKLIYCFLRLKSFFTFCSTSLLKMLNIIQSVCMRWHNEYLHIRNNMRVYIGQPLLIFTSSLQYKKPHRQIDSFIVTIFDDSIVFMISVVKEWNSSIEIYIYIYNIFNNIDLNERYDLEIQYLIFNFKPSVISSTRDR